MEFMVYKMTNTRLGNLYFFMTSEFEGWTRDETGGTWFDAEDIDSVVDYLGDDAGDCYVLLRDEN